MTDDQDQYKNVGTGNTAVSHRSFDDITGHIAIKKNIEDYQKLSFNTFYHAYYQELVSEMMSGRWQKIDVMIAILIAATASGSTIAGWSLWNEPSWKFFWVFISGSVSLGSFAHGIIGVSSRIKELEELRQMFCELRIDLETFQQQLTIGLSVEQASSKYDELRKRYSQCMKRTHPDIILTMGFRKKVQDLLNKTLKEEGHIQ